MAYSLDEQGVDWVSPVVAHVGLCCVGLLGYNALIPALLSLPLSMGCIVCCMDFPFYL